MWTGGGNNDRALQCKGHATAMTLNWGVCHVEFVLLGFSKAHELDKLRDLSLFRTRTKPKTEDNWFWPLHIALVQDSIALSEGSTLQYQSTFNEIRQA